MSESIRGRRSTNGEAFGISTTLAISSGFILPAVQSALTLTVHEIFNNEKLRFAGILVFGAAALVSNAASVYIEYKALKEKGYSNSPVTTGANKLIEKPALISLASHVYHLAVLGLINPVNIMTFINILNGDQTSRLVLENALSIATVNAGWNILTDGLIWKEKITPLVRKLEKVNKKVDSLVKPIADKTIKPLITKTKDTLHLYLDG
jgi:hypothetical protein